ncbi:TfuA domain-containing protein [Nocardioides sp. TF02-7]|uniref:TfuA domain-containing protein n=1 Tax=Nocardioides sp. TF02-7 TaxID=2917724 RepID=UPI001F057D12|nr:TfuA domain-containing protein [Nocardioides sp. TF02-7]UMG93990.1 TfuA domain-containing protein [Nocardioides sp. TF02-7]
MADEDDQKAPARRKQAIKLKSEQRWLVGLLGAAGMGAGSVATFLDAAEVGPAVMIGIGAIFFLIGLAGVLPTRLKIGDTEAEFWQEVGEKVGEVLEQLPPQTRAEVLASIATSAPEAVGPSLQAAAYDEMIIQMVKDAVDAINANRIPEQHVKVIVPTTRTPQFDVTVIDPLNGELEIDIKGYSKPAGADAVHKLVSRSTITANVAPRSNRRAMLITRSGISKSAKAVADQFPNVVTVEIAGPEDGRKLVSALERGLTFN